MCFGGSPKIVQPQPMPQPEPAPQQPPQVTVTPPPIIPASEPKKKRQARPTTKARQRRASLGGVTGKRKFMIPISGYSTSSGSGVNA